MLGIVCVYVIHRQTFCPRTVWYRRSCEVVGSRISHHSLPATSRLCTRIKLWRWRDICGIKCFCLQLSLQ